MKKSDTPDKLKRDYEKVYEHPLDWCPMFGYLPEIENTHLEKDGWAYEIAHKCLIIIERARQNLGIHDNDNNAVKYICSPEIDKPPISIYLRTYGYDEKLCKAVRLLFQKLDFIAFKTSEDPVHIYEYNALFKNRSDLPNAMFRDSNRYASAMSIMAEDVHVLQAVQDKLLHEAKKVIAGTFNLEFHDLYALYAILEAWLTLTALLFHNKRSEDIDDLFLFKKFYKAEKLLQHSDDWRESIENQDLQAKISRHSEMQSLKAKRKAEIEKKNKQAHRDAIANEARKICADKHYIGQGAKWVSQQIEKKMGGNWNDMRRWEEIVIPVKEYKKSRKSTK